MEALLTVLRDVGLGFVRIGLLAFGGGLGILPEMERLAVTAHGWVTHREFVDIFAGGEVHEDVGRLRGEHRRDQQLERRREVQLAVRVGVPHGQGTVHPSGAARAGEGGLHLCVCSGHDRQPMTRRPHPNASPLTCGVAPLE